MHRERVVPALLTACTAGIVDDGHLTLPMGLVFRLLFDGDAFATQLVETTLELGASGASLFQALLSSTQPPALVADTVSVLARLARSSVKHYEFLAALDVLPGLVQ